MKGREKGEGRREEGEGRRDAHDSFWCCGWGFDMSAAEFNGV